MTAVAAPQGSKKTLRYHVPGSPPACISGSFWLAGLKTKREEGICSRLLFVTSQSEWECDTKVRARVRVRDRKKTKPVWGSIQLALKWTNRRTRVSLFLSPSLSLCLSLSLSPSLSVSLSLSLSVSLSLSLCLCLSLSLSLSLKMFLIRIKRLQSARGQVTCSHGSMGQISNQNIMNLGCVNLVQS